MNLTIVVDDDTLKRARIRAIQENTFGERGASGIPDDIFRGRSAPGRSLRAATDIVASLHIQAGRRDVDEGRAA